MNATTKNIAAAASLALLAACGGSGGGNAALSKNFNYGTGQAPSASEKGAADAAQTSLTAAASFNTAPDATKGLSIISFADVIAAAAFGNASFGGVRSSHDGVLTAIRNADTNACATVTASTITFNNCSQGDSGFTLTLNGSISATASSITWALTGVFAGTENNVNLHVTTHLSGTMGVTASKITGNSLSDFSGSASGQGQSLSFAFATAALVDLTYQTAPQSCVSGGTLEVKRVWTEKPNGASGSQFADVGVKLTWSACNKLTVARST